MEGRLTPPSSVHAVPNYSPPADEHREEAASLEARCEGVLRSGGLPTVDVVVADGRLFAVNGDWLAACQKLEKTGVCSAVRISVVPDASVPAQLRRAIEAALASGTELDGMQTAYAVFTGGSAESSDDGESLNNKVHSSSGSDWSLSDENDSCNDEPARHDSADEQAEALIQ